jgi:hypothetical protein
MKPEDIKAGRYYQGHDGRVRLAVNDQNGFMHWKSFGGHGTSTPSNAKKNFAEWAKCEVEPIWKEVKR